MKRNVDLTEDRFFSDNWRNNVLNSVFTLSLFSDEKFPWNVFGTEIVTDEDLCSRQQRNAIIIVGDKTTRAKVKFYRKMDSEDYCDCCGKRMNLKPWDKEYGLCHKCDEYYSKKLKIDKCQWRKKEEINNVAIW